MVSWTSISAAIIITALICVPVAATIFSDDSESLNVAGSTTVQPLMLELQTEFEKFANVNMNVTGGGSGVGVSSTLNGVADIGMLSRDLKDSEAKGILIPHVIAMDAVVVIVNDRAGLGDDPDLTMKQLADIYSGKVTDWGQVGGRSGQSIAVVAREEGSGTRDCFEAALKKYGDPNFKMKDRVNSVNSTGAILAAVNNTPGAIGYINFNVSDGIQSNTVTVSVDGIKATKDTILKTVDDPERYEISRDLILVTNGPETGMVKFFIEWVWSTEGQDIVEKAGFVRIDGV
jgi:phosphate transport system substrate-binding protein